jgi:hypothetical protein
VTAVQNDGKSFISYAAACERYRLTPKALRDLIRRHGLAVYQPITADRRYYVRRDALDAVADIPEGSAPR